MTSYERVMAALDHRKPDRPPLNLFGPPETWDKLKKHLRLEDDEAVHCALGADMRYVGPRYVGPATFTGQSGYHGGGTDMWGVAWEPAENRFATYNEIAFHPLATAMTLKAIEEYAWPDPGWLSVSHLKDEIARFDATERRAIVYAAGGSFETAWFLRGIERFLMDLVECPDLAELILRKVSQLTEEVARRAVDAAATFRVFLSEQFRYYHESRPHLSLDRNAPVPRQVDPTECGEVISIPHLARPSSMAGQMVWDRVAG